LEKQYKTFRKKKKIIEKYNFSSKLYDKRYKALQQEKYSVALNRYEIRGKTFLDLGCGTGLLVEHIFDSKSNQLNGKYHYIGVDISWNMLVSLKSKVIRGKSNSNIMFILSDIENLPFRDNTFKLILSFTSFQNLPNIEDGILDSLRVSAHNCDFKFSILRKKLDLKALVRLLNPIVKNIEIIDQENLEDVVIQGKIIKAQN
jgi:ubiquinone/menaquinone biosynthesis C-methylase UbiE